MTDLFNKPYKCTAADCGKMVTYSKMLTTTNGNFCCKQCDTDHAKTWENRG